jgi:hypothetical protein
LDLGRKSLCKAPVTSEPKGLIYAGLKRVRVSWPEVEPQLTPHSRVRRFGRRSAKAEQLLSWTALQHVSTSLEQRGRP